MTGIKITGYIVGVLVHVISKWSGWKGAEKGRKWLDWWRLYSAKTVQGLTFDFFIFLLWWMDLLFWVVTKMGFDLSTLPPLPDGVDFAAAAALGYIADSAGKTFWAIGERVFRAGIGAFNGKDKR